MYKQIFNLNKETAVITGAGSGIGREAALILAEYGAKVVLLDINEENVFRAANQINKDLGDNCAEAIIADVSKEEDVEEAVGKIVDKYEHVNILINNAGVMKQGPFEKLTLTEWKAIMEINLNSAFLMSSYIGKHMIEQNNGKIINMASISSVVANRESQSAYNVSKAGINMLTKCLAVEWAKYNIRVNSIAPGYTKTGMTKNLSNDSTTESNKKLLQNIPMNRISHPSEIAGMILHLASEASSYSTGGIYSVDGGYLAY